MKFSALLLDLVILFSEKANMRIPLQQQKSRNLIQLPDAKANKEVKTHTPLLETACLV